MTSVSVKTKVCSSSWPGSRGTSSPEEPRTTVRYEEALDAAGGEGRGSKTYCGSSVNLLPDQDKPSGGREPRLNRDEDEDEELEEQREHREEDRDETEEEPDGEDLFRAPARVQGGEDETSQGGVRERERGKRGPFNDMSWSRASDLLARGKALGQRGPELLNARAPPQLCECSWTGLPFPLPLFSPPFPARRPRRRLR